MDGIDNSVDGPSPLWPGGHNVHDFQKQFEMWTRQTTAHFSTLLQSISDELEPREAGDISGCCWYRAFALHCRVSSGTNVIISLTEWCRFLMQCCLRDQRSRTLNVGFCLLHAEISPDSLNLLMTLWTVDDEIPQFVATVHWEMFFLNCKTICSRSCSQSGEPRHSINRFTCGMFQTGVFKAFLNFPS